MPAANRKYDHEAMNRLVSALRTQGSLTLEFATKSQATYHRHQFYSWRRQQRELNDSMELEDIVVRVDDNRLTFVGGFAGEALRDALKGAGVDV